MSVKSRLIVGITLPLFLLTVVAHLFLSEAIAFLLAALTLGGLSAMIGLAIENIAQHYSLAATDVLQTMLGSIPLVLVVLFFLADGKSDLAQTIIVGSILANGLFVLGATFLSGSVGRGSMKFDKELANGSSILFIMAIMALAFTGAAVSGSDYSKNALYSISVGASLVLLITYFIWTYLYIKQSPIIREVKEKTELTPKASFAMIVAASLLSALVAWWLTEDADPIIELFSLSQMFVGAILFPLVASAAGNTSAIFLARTGHPKLAVTLVQGSIAQITAFLFPLLVLVSFFLPTRLNLATSGIFVTILGLSGLVIRQITNDGEAGVFEGAALVGSFLIFAVLAYFFAPGLS